MATPGPRVRSNSFDLSSIVSCWRDTLTASTPLQFPSSYTSGSKQAEFPKIQTRTGFFADTVVADFYRRRHKGAIFNNSMDSGHLDMEEIPSDVLVSQKQIACAYDYSNWSQHYQLASEWNWVGAVGYSDLAAGSSKGTSFLDLTSVPMLNTSVITDLAVSQAWANIDQSEILALASAKEANQTISGLFSTATKVVKVFKAVKRFEVKKMKGLLFKDPRIRAKKLKSIASQAEDVYMEARYNLRPLYYDMIGLLKLTQPCRPRQTFRGFEGRSESGSDTEIYRYSGFAKPTIGKGVNMRLTRTATRRVTARAGVLTDILDPGLASRMGIKSLFATVYDLTPYSFIADWFFNVGDTLLSWVPKPGVRTLASWVTIEQIDECFNQIDLIDYDPGSGNPTPWGYGQYGYIIDFQATPATKSWRNVKKWRLPHPSRAIVPHFSLNVDPLKQIDLFIILKKMISYR